MKNMKKFKIWGAGLILALAGQACVSEDPFSSGGEGTLKLSAEIRSEITTRAGDLTSDPTLRDKCVVYIETSRGLIRKFKGLDNIPELISLKSGKYLAEAWTGDSVSASFGSKFYRGMQEFTIADGDNKALSLKCNIANVVVSVNPDALSLGITDLKVTFSHSRGSLEFTEDNIRDAKGYFMMPNADKNLSYKVEGLKADGTPIKKEGIIQNVERAHEYVLNITAEAGGNNQGGALIKIRIDDIPLIEEVVEIYGRPTIEGVEFNIDEQVVGIPGTPEGEKNAFTDKIVYVRGYEGIYRLQLRGGQNFQELGHIIADLNLIQSDINKAELEAHGITWDGPNDVYDAATGKRMAEMRITFKKAFFDHLPQKDTEYRLDIIARDNQAQPKHRTKTLRVATSEAAVEVKAPVEAAPAPDPENEPMAVLSKSATLTGYVMAEDATDYGIKYRKQGDSEWIRVAAQTTRAARTEFTVSLTGLEPNTTYEYAAYASGYDDGEIQTITTESVFVIPNSSMEEWGEYQASTPLGTKTVKFPGTERNFWDSGNAGAAAANDILTEPSSVMINSGATSVKLTSKECGLLSIKKFAAGNLFAGEYVRTDGTDGVLSFGRPYDGSHPSKLSVYVNYRPAVGSGKGANDSYIASGQMDQGQIYVALSTEAVEIRTKSSKQKLFNPDDACILAYGQLTLTENFGPDGGLEKIEIPIEYYDRAKNHKPKYLVIVCSASKYGDYFSGGPGSTMYLDDFELIYDK